MLSAISYSQVNRYSKPTQPARYEPITDINYYKAQTQQLSNSIAESSASLKSKVDYYIKNTTDSQFRSDLYEVQSYLNPLFGTKWISVADAEWYLKKATRKYNKSVRQYNKRLKKKQK